MMTEEKKAVVTVELEDVRKLSAYVWALRTHIEQLDGNLKSLKTEIDSVILRAACMEKEANE